MFAIALYVSGTQGLDVEGNCYCVSQDKSEDRCRACDSECQPLSYYVKNHSVLQNNTTFMFLPGDHQLGDVWKFDSLENISLKASCNDSSIFANITCENNSSSGLLFENISHLTIAGLGFSYCGNNESKYMVASLLLINVWNLHMSWVEIHNSTGWGMYCSLLLGNSVITHTNITDGHHSGSYSGGNIRFKYEEDDDEYDWNTHNVTISDSVISGGRENQRDRRAYSGGIDIYITTRRKIHLTFTGVILDNNYGYDGGNVAITYTTLDNGWNSSVTFKNCNFSNGSASDRGGAIFLEATMKRKVNSSIIKEKLILEVIDSNFTHNTARAIGGGMYLQVHESQYLTVQSRIRFTNCNFTNNTVPAPFAAQGGFAVHVANFKLPGSVPHHLPQYNIMFEECFFQHNGMITRDRDSLGCGVLYISENGLTILHNVTITDNNCTAIAAAQSTIEMSGTIIIQNNTGFNGGGLLLCENSVIFLTTGVQVHIRHNQAYNFGGGIYAEFECSQDIASCFYGTETKEKSVFLLNNTAKAGDAVYGGAIDHCFTASNSLLENSTVRVKFDELFNVTPNNSLSAITSDPYQVCFCNGSKTFNKSSCNAVHNYTGDIYPGMEIRVYVVIVGQRNGTAPGVVIANIGETTSGVKISINHHQQSQVIKSAKSCVELQYSIHVSSNKTLEEYCTSLNLFVENGYYQTLGPQMFNPASINFCVKPCPYSFELSESECKCLDALSSLLDGISCNIQSQTYTRPERAQWWMGFKNNSIILVSQYCPFDYCCQDCKRVYISSGNDKATNKQCAFKRTGILCGKCPPHLSNIFGSSKCKDCHSYTLPKTLALSLLFGVVGLVLLILVGLLNLNVAEGAINPIIFYMNIVRINHSTFFDSCKEGHVCVEKVLGVFVAWMNLDLELDTCYYDGMNALGKSALQFVFPFYLWILTGLIICLSRRFTLVSRIAGKNSVRLLATIILLSYAKVIRAIIDVMWPSQIYQLNNTSVTFFQNVWKIDGHIQYFHQDHQYLFLFAIAVAILTLPYTLVLLTIQWLKKVSNYKVLLWVVKLKPFFDAYTGPYKDKYHFWPGFLLLVRIILFLAIAANVSEGPILNLTLVCVTAATLFLFNQPGVYKSWLLSLIESFTYFNLILFSIGTAYVLQQNSHKSYSQQGYHKEKTVLVCVGSMFLLFCGIVTWNIYQCLGGALYWEKLKVWLQEKNWPWRKRKSVRPLLLQNSVTNSVGSSSSEDELDPILRNAPPVARYDKLREPLVETH